MYSIFKNLNESIRIIDDHQGVTRNCQNKIDYDLSQYSFF